MVQNPSRRLIRGSGISLYGGVLRPRIECRFQRLLIQKASGVVETATVSVEAGSGGDDPPWNSLGMAMGRPARDYDKWLVEADIVEGDDGNWGLLVRELEENLLEDAGENLVPAPVVANGGLLVDQAMAEPSVLVQEKDAKIRDAEILSGKRQNSPMTSELSTGKMNSQAPGWNKRQAKEQEERDAEIAKKYQGEIQLKALQDEQRDNQIAKMYQELYDQNATDEQVARAAEVVNVGGPIDDVSTEPSQACEQVPIPTPVVNVGGVVHNVSSESIPGGAGQQVIRIVSTPSSSKVSLHKRVLKRQKRSRKPPPADGVHDAGSSKMSAEAQIYAADTCAIVGKETSPPTSEFFTGKLNPRRLDRIKGQLRIGAAAPSRAPCPSRLSAFEKAVRGYADNPLDNVITPTLGTSFDSLREAYDFYNL
uniref:Uncharacterized protein n=1 Tax=Aegilops tauschii TaxID=37682 RepID=N1R4K7_AEGTA